MDSKRFHSVRLDKSLCKGCTNCLTHCPTEAIRVRDGRAHIIDERCIDCGECIRICSYHAKVAQTDPLSAIDQFKYKIALPAPSLYGQFKGIKNVSQILSALRLLGFDDVFEVARGADVAARAIKEKLRNKDLPRPLISSACPAVTRLIQVRFPGLIPNIVDVRQPMEVAALMARKEFGKKHGVPEEEVGCFFITPCPAKMTAIRSPIGQEASAADGAISIMEIYGLLISHIKGLLPEAEDAASASGVRWANSGGEARAVCPDNSLAVDGVQNVIRVLEEIENGKLSDLEFFEGSACTGGCVGGPLTFENNYVAKNAIRKLADELRAAHPKEKSDVSASVLAKYPLYSSRTILPNSIMQLDEDMAEAMRKMERIEEIVKNLPGFDCGSCGAPTCRALAEDVVRGYARELDCVHKLKEQLKVMAQQMVDLAQDHKQ